MRPTSWTSIKRAIAALTVAAVPAATAAAAEPLPKAGAARLLVVTEGSATDGESQRIRSLARFIGLDATNTSAAGLLEGRLKAAEVAGVAISAKALSHLTRQAAEKALERVGSSAPLLIFDVDAQTGSGTLRDWSEDALTACSPTNAPKAFTLKVAEDAQFAGPLAGWKLPSAVRAACHLASAPSATSLLSAVQRGAQDSLLLRTGTGKNAVYFTPHLERFDTGWLADPRGLPGAFSSYAPYLMFLKEAAQDRAWHLDGAYANLTIDDPWLSKDRYGALDYRALLGEMKRHDFHTTIAFVPWNYDRSDPETVALFRANAQRYSLSIHGNNHLHREFGPYGEHSLAQQERDIRQAVLKMDRLRQLTGLGYDRFMVFPHGVAPEATLTALEKAGFLGTANSLNVPLDRTAPGDPFFLLRPFTYDFGGLLSLFRYPANEPIPAQEIAIQSYLGNPLLFYGHADLFESSISAFDPYADTVNRTDPATHWAGLGEIARHMSLMRKLADGSVEVVARAGEMAVRNPEPVPVLFRIEKPAPGCSSDQTIVIDGKPISASCSAGGYSWSVRIPAGEVRQMRFEGAAEQLVATEKIDQGGAYAWIIRHVSDFRDMSLSQSHAGQRLTSWYYERGGMAAEHLMERYKALLFAMLLAIAVIGFRLLRILRLRI